MTEAIQKVAEFHKVFEVDRNVTPDLQALRIRLLEEEVKEFNAEVSTLEDPAKILKEASDILYILFGTLDLLELSEHLPAAFAEVHRSNMSKLGEDGKPIRRADGKILKNPETYTPADIRNILSTHKP